MAESMNTEGSESEDSELGQQDSSTDHTHLDAAQLT